MGSRDNRHIHMCIYLCVSANVYICMYLYVCDRWSWEVEITKTSKQNLVIIAHERPWEVELLQYLSCAVEIKKMRELILKSL